MPENFCERHVSAAPTVTSSTFQALNMGNPPGYKLNLIYEVRSHRDEGISEVSEIVSELIGDRMEQ